MVRSSIDSLASDNGLPLQYHKNRERKSRKNFTQLLVVSLILPEDSICQESRPGMRKVVDFWELEVAHKELNAIPMTYVKKLGMVVNAYSAGAEGIEARQIFGSYWSTSLA